jgi:hypothetical protein
MGSVGVSAKHRAAFEAFHAANPQVYRALEKLAFKLKNKGVNRWGIKALWEVLRYEMAIATDAPARGYALNNNLTAHYARELMRRNPEDLANFFELRTRQGALDALDADCAETRLRGGVDEGAR